ncbi:hypothetical protein RRG08_004178 [Elysia crispata]|uniref:Uncharacterized protein n=1 Tax=Elysia crispata TaxID=231223 RepID=A0AAE1D5T0_9GAST|nr:hypothetical protein RRG08_004178 [Elysia crispata]
MPSVLTFPSKCVTSVRNQRGALKDFMKLRTFPINPENALQSGKARSSKMVEVPTSIQSASQLEPLSSAQLIPPAATLDTIAVFIHIANHSRVGRYEHILSTMKVSTT